jgi:hypothetical protein
VIPSDYRLEEVVARLIERLEGSRRSYAGDADGAREAFARIANEHVESAIGEFREVAMADNPDVHAGFLRREVSETFLPRYHRLAVAMTEAEEAGFGLGRLGGVAGRIAFPVAMLVLMAILPRMRMVWAMWLAVPAFVLAPFVPDIARMFGQARYHRGLQSILADMVLVQSRGSAYLPVDQLRIDDPEDPRSSRRRRKPDPPTRETP